MPALGRGRRLLLLLLLLVAAAGTCLVGGAPDEAQPPVVSRIAFGSCRKESAPQPIWSAISRFHPQVFVWLGDNIYGDNQRPLRLVGGQRTAGPWQNVPMFFPSSVEEMRRRYEVGKSEPGYAQLRQTAQVIGTWDDHDYGLNDAGKEFSAKNATQKLMLDFLDEPEDSPRREQDGVYTSYVFGPKGKQVKVILLDTRYHRDPLFSDGNLLGDSQWDWLERELAGPKTEITIIGSSIQVISNLSAAGSPIISMECWGHFPKERERLYKLIDDSKRNGIFFISGDIHFGEITRYDCGTQYSLYDITSSGLNQGLGKDMPPLIAFFLRTIFWVVPSTMRVFSMHCPHRSCTYAQPNFGVIVIEWDAIPPKIKVELRDVSGEPVAGVDILLSELQPGDGHKRPAQGSSYQHHCSLETNLPWFLRNRLALVLFSLVPVSVATFILLVKFMTTLSKKFLRKLKLD